LRDHQPISVVIPHFESTASLRRTVDSVLNQSVLPSEIIIVDDASSDAAQRAAQAIASSITMVRCRFTVLEVNSGPGAARNVGWDLSNQPVLAFVDADDSWFPRKIELQSSLLLGRDALLDVVGHPMMISLGSAEPAVLSGVGEEAGFAMLDKRQWLWRNRFATSSVMVRRELPFRFQVDGRHSEDYELWLRMAYAGLRMAVMDVPLGTHHKARFGDSGLSSQMWAMERGELRAFRSLRRSGLISNLTLGATATGSLAKYGVRVLRVSARRMSPPREEPSGSAHA
jgi:teichuronic acid biosynthesis glycosyltransferase TuaG